MAKRTSITLTVIRCGETAWDALGRVHGATDLPLSDAGRSALLAEVKSVGGVKAATIHHPPDEAARDTARLFATAGAKLKEVPELNDPNLGLLEGLTEEAFSDRFRSRHKQWSEDPIMLSPPEGEDVAVAADRMFKAVARILRRSRSDDVVVVLHTLCRAMLRCWLADRPFVAMRDMEGGPVVERIVIPTATIDALGAAAESIATPS
jgi:probable phosphoglycerate mutase